MNPEAIPNAVINSQRRIVLKNPNTLPCQVFRMTVQRTEPVSAGTPTIGGMGVLTPDDEDDVIWQEIGVGYALPLEQYQPGLMVDRQDAQNGAGDDFRYAIEPEHERWTDGWFDIKQQDIVLILLHDVVKVAYEVVGLENIVNIPPYAWRYILQRRDDMHRVLQAPTGP